MPLHGNPNALVLRNTLRDDPLCAAGVSGLVAGEDDLENVETVVGGEGRRFEAGGSADTGSYEGRIARGNVGRLEAANGRLGVFAAVPLQRVAAVLVDL